ncbi:MAG: endopeptidase La [bacterium (Candidatus Stahlbacteria) CG23_combo_of_CG06-09_8_20_14_all_34_7]|nr:MAG: endopeptidase La [bacterium (Candidatus Stahlbacteria) CG23_combo_of_CG06-09_8_20_14_all_34_7]
MELKDEEKNKEIKKNEEQFGLSDTLSVLAKNDVIVYPLLILPVAVMDQNSIKLIDDALAGSKIIFVGFTKSTDLSTLKKENIENYGVAANIMKMLRFPDGSIRILIQGIKRAKIEEFIDSDKPYPIAKIKYIEESEVKGLREEALTRNLKESFRQYIKLSQQFPDEIFQILDNIEDGWKLADFIASNLPIDIDLRYEILSTKNVIKRMERMNEIMQKEISILELRQKIKLKVTNEINEDQKKFFLREQLRAIKKELGEDDPKDKEIKEIKEKVEKKNMPLQAKEIFDKEVEKLEMMNPMMPDYNVSRTYIDWILDLPWSLRSDDNLDIKRAEKILNDDHYDLEKVKKRILEYLAVKKLKNDSKGPILCFVGPPGVGKTSLGKSIARALGRNFVRISLGGMHDEAEIRGHRRTYVSAMPGRILQEIKKAKTSNPVFMLDEIDKIGSDFRGDPASALLEALDPQQNDTFQDHYLDMPYDLSQVMFITTANILYTIPPALLDRMEIISLPGYTIDEKMLIAKKYLIPRQIEENGINVKHIQFTDDGLKEIIDGYTREAGVRNIERTIGDVCRKVARDIAENKNISLKVTKQKVVSLLGKRRFLSDVAEKKADVGIATGMAWTPNGGEILFVEAIKMPGKGNLILTGQLGDVMKESAKAALSYIKANYKKFKINIEDFKKYDLHIHLPEGAIPKDGPSAGITLATAIVSVLSGIPIRNDISMTGEITLRGKILPVGGVKEKVIGAKIAGIMNIIMPKFNGRDLDDIPATTKKGMKFYFVNKFDEVLDIALVRKLKKREIKK